jgi:ankyrin repeat protein
MSSIPLEALLFEQLLHNNDILQYLLGIGGDPNLVGENGTAPLHEAIYQGNIVAIDYLRRAGADIELRTSANLTPLSLAVLRGDTLIVDSLLARGANAICTTLVDWSALQQAGLIGYEEMVRITVDANIGSSFQNDDGWSYMGTWLNMVILGVVTITMDTYEVETITCYNHITIL